MTITDMLTHAPPSPGTAMVPSEPAGSWAVLTGDSVHCFGDGVLIASAFVADLRLGAIAALAVLAHEVPHHMGDLMVLRAGSSNKRAALIKVTLAGAVTALGGMHRLLAGRPAAGLASIFPGGGVQQLHLCRAGGLDSPAPKRLTARETAAQIAWLGVGIGMVALVSSIAHAH